MRIFIGSTVSEQVKAMIETSKTALMRRFTAADIKTDVPIGEATVQWKEGKGWFLGVLVGPEHQGHGLGSEILSNLLAMFFSGREAEHDDAGQSPPSAPAPTQQSVASNKWVPKRLRGAAQTAPPTNPAVVASSSPVPNTTAITAGIWRDNEVSIQFFRKHGFTTVWQNHKVVNMQLTRNAYKGLKAEGRLPTVNAATRVVSPFSGWDTLTSSAKTSLSGSSSTSSSPSSLSSSSPVPTTAAYNNNQNNNVAHTTWERSDRSSQQTSGNSSPTILPTTTTPTTSVSNAKKPSSIGCSSVSSHDSSTSSTTASHKKNNPAATTTWKRSDRSSSQQTQTTGTGHGSSIPITTTQKTPTPPAPTGSSGDKVVAWRRSNQSPTVTGGVPAWQRTTQTTNTAAAQQTGFKFQTNTTNTYSSSPSNTTRRWGSSNNATNNNRSNNNNWWQVNDTNRREPDRANPQQQHPPSNTAWRPEGPRHHHHQSRRAGGYYQQGGHNGRGQFRSMYGTCR
eukprot:TRINITY_DN66746_c6_g8_i3.p1 TRINITY_DN66746_c6_g8~~TRINITY_DN66746_c6_g8_i3.p1  ORF type:complete len:507 (-),score=103.63 TRINITY_DN66746_c6_g8_i3:8-1528(-)